MYENYADLAKKIRKHCLHMVHIGQSGHIGSMLSVADLLAVLYGGTLKIDPQAPERPDRDRLIFSKGHAGAAVYAALAEQGSFPGMDRTYDQNGENCWGTSAIMCRAWNFPRVLWAMACP